MMTIDMVGQCLKNCLYAVLNGKIVYEEFIKKDSDKGYILEVDVKYPKNYMVCMRIYHSYRKE